jgi:hypothetical protein
MSTLRSGFSVRRVSSRASNRIHVHSAVPAVAATFLLVLLALPSASAGTIVLRYGPPFRHHAVPYEFTSTFLPGTSNGSCGGAGTGLSQAPPTFSLTTGQGQIDQAVALKTCGANGDVNAVSAVGLRNAHFNVTTTGTYSIAAVWKIGYAYNLSVTLNGSKPNGTMNLVADFSITGCLTVRVVQGSTVKHKCEHLVSATDFNGSLVGSAGNTTYMIRISNIRLSAGTTYEMGSTLSAVVDAYDSCLFPGTVCPPTGSSIASSLDLRTPPAHGAELVSLTISI